MPCCSTNRSQRSSAITSIRLEMERFSKEAICSSLFRCSSRTVRLSFALLLFFLDFGIRSLGSASASPHDGPVCPQNRAHDFFQFREDFRELGPANPVKQDERTEDCGAREIKLDTLSRI